MKLTNDQIEIERKKFEVYMTENMYHESSFEMFGGRYLTLSVQQDFRVWLASSESNNEIEFPESTFSMRVLNIYIENIYCKA